MIAAENKALRQRLDEMTAVENSPGLARQQQQQQVCGTREKFQQQQKEMEEQVEENTKVSCLNWLLLSSLPFFSFFF